MLVLVNAARRPAARALVVVACAALPLAACGKKGPPLAPLPRLPAAPAQVSASRAADVVTIRFTVPEANVSGLRPADVERIDVYAWTGPELPVERLFKLATVVASVPVRLPPPPQSDEKDAVPPPPPVGPGVDQGATTELRETLGSEAFQPLEPPASKKKAIPPVRQPNGPDVTPLPPPLMRRYVVVGVNRGDTRGTPSSVVAVPLWTPPPPPASVTAQARESSTELTWAAPAGLRRPVQEPTIAQPPEANPAPAVVLPQDKAPEREDAPPQQATSGAPAPTPAAQTAGTPGVPTPAAEVAGQTADASGRLPSKLLVPWPTAAIGYHVYEVAPEGKPAAPRAGEPSPADVLPRRLTTEPLRAMSFSDGRADVGLERCYVVRTVEAIGALSVESEASARACADRTDVFPPAPPKSVAAIASEGTISLIWDANAEADLAGYIVVRGVAPGAPAERLTPAPIREATFRDTSVKPGTRYVYAVIAVDAATPPNESGLSNTVEETAR